MPLSDLLRIHLIHAPSFPRPLYSQGEGWQDLNLFANTTVDSGTDGETPVVNHIEVNGHYEAESPYYDLTLNGTTIEGLQLFQHWASEAPVTGDVPTRISIDSNALGKYADSKQDKRFFGVSK